MSVFSIGTDHNHAALDVRGVLSFTKEQMKQLFSRVLEFWPFGSYRQVRAICIGQQTRAAASALGMQTGTAEKAALQALIQCLKESIAEESREKHGGIIMKGITYGVGVGPGDPELMTLKAVRLIRENDVIAVPGKVAKEAVAYQIAAAAVPEIAEKELVPIYMPMVKDREGIRAEHEKSAKLIERYLDQGKNVVYLTLGDSTIYCTFSYLQHIMEADGYQVELVSGIPSFCAAAARVKLPLAEWDEPLHIVPAVHKTDEPLHYEGNYVLMKSASHMKEVKELLRQKGLQVCCVENCSMDTEKVYRSLEEIPDDAGYFSLIIAKEHKTV